MPTASDLTDFAREPLMRTPPVRFVAGVAGLRRPCRRRCLRSQILFAAQPEVTAAPFALSLRSTSRSRRVATSPAASPSSRWLGRSSLRMQPAQRFPRAILSLSLTCGGRLS
jgi:hypothetical protein